MAETPPESASPPEEPQEGPGYDILQRARRRAEIDEINIRRADQGQQLVPYDEERTPSVDIVPVVPGLLAARGQKRSGEQPTGQLSINQAGAGAESSPTPPPSAE